MADQSVAATHREVGLSDAISLFFKNYFVFEGRSSRGAYWFATLFSFIVSIATMAFDAVFIPYNEWSPLNSIYSLAVFCPSIALGARRLHDIGRSGWWQLLVLTFVGIIPVIYWACQPGQRRENQFGTDVEQGRAAGKSHDR